MWQRESQEKELILQREITFLYKSKTFSNIFMAISSGLFRSATFWQWTTKGADRGTQCSPHTICRRWTANK